ncbi:aldehyde dehydrogenase [Basidiobolus meristosporus CBS 931.73]|uniref:Aldehyde dehydrogenase n=1 Tax=Basidiobolus meristosporus CBS 931.73 TaxID=1314790 RepID=A0A1Y1ZCF4_9FUNG|nr:aldehyde dehydrogenase [Basidiobolus meristosporus CBS 931.73]|eukprot:ORY07844.1 aldehyde dehydrogenase [Basidiobolus meristosporus CBS 931.73]
MVIDNFFSVDNFINGEYIAPSSGQYIDNFNPSTGKVYSQVANSGVEDVNNAVEAASKALPLWSATSREERSKVLLRIADLWEARAKEFAHAESKDQGKPATLAMDVDVLGSVAMFRYFVWKIAPCIAAGCTAVCKPSEFTSVTANMLCAVMKEAGLPDGVCNMVFGTGSQTGSVLVEHPQVAAISFTGGCETGSKINEAGSRGLKKVALELGGKNANIVFEDVDLPTCIPVSVKSAFLNQGEICLCNSRMFVHRSVYDEFLELFVAETKKLVVGDPSNKSTFMGPVVNRSQYEKILGYIELAKQEGGKIECGGVEKPSGVLGTELEGGYFIQPTVITGLSPNSRVMQEEIFGPVVAICPFDDEDEVIALANGTKYGLSASVWSRCGQRARRVAEKLRTGNVWINTWMVRDMSMPIGGVKASGLGREGGPIMAIENFFSINNFINGKYISPVSGQYIDNFNPSTGKVYSQVANSGVEDVNNAVEAASKALPLWSATSREERSKVLLRIADLWEARAKEFAHAESKDQGKPATLAMDVDVLGSVAMFRYFVWKIAPCIAAGCTAVCKPSEFTSVTANMLCAVMKEAGLPDGVCNMVFGTGSQTGSVLVEHPQVAAISFTGGCETGSKINEAGSRGLKKVALELGGKNANIVFEDVDLPTCIPVSVKSAFLNQGEICLCNSRMFIHRSVYDEFLELFVAETKKLVVGDPSNKSTFMGPVVNRSQYEKILGYIELAKQEGGKIECGGVEKPPGVLGTELEGGYFIQPTVITGLSPNSRVMQEEIFGPVVAICPFDDEDEVIALANGTKYGLSASVWSRCGQRARRVAEKLRTGNVWINTWMVRDMSMPIGGVKASGLGREGGEYALNFFTDYKSIMMKN